MKLFFGEFNANYSKYHFPYQVWLLKENGDEITKIFDSGFLPMRHLLNVYYLCRSVRVDLGKFGLSSENRRIWRKTEDFEFSLIPIDRFNYTAEVQKTCKESANVKLGKVVFTSQAIKHIFKNGVYNYVLSFKKISTGENAGYVVCYINDKIVQYAHAFYKQQYFKENLGAGMMLRSVIWAKESSKEYIYLGTCYGEETLYKTEFAGVEYFNGFRWNNDLKELKKLIGGKEVGEKEEYLLKNKSFLGEFYKGDLQEILNKYGVRVTF